VIIRFITWSIRGPKTEIGRTDHHPAKPLTLVERLADIPEEDVWLAKQKSVRRRA